MQRDGFCSSPASCVVLFSSLSPPTPPPRPLQIQASLLACEGLSGVCLVPTVASKKMMPKQSSKQAEGRERGSSPDVLVRRGGSGLGGVTPWGGAAHCGVLVLRAKALRQDGEKSRSRKEEETAEASQPKKSIKKAGWGWGGGVACPGRGAVGRGLTGPPPRPAGGGDQAELLLPAEDPQELHLRAVLRGVP